MMHASSPLWATVLAGGSGRRLAAITGGVPRQFCGFGGGRTLLAETLERIAPLVKPARTSVVVDRAHERHFDGRCLQGTSVLHQPCDRCTAAGVLLGLPPALESGGDPIVLVTPSDHGVLGRSELLKSVREVVASVESGRYGIVLLGAEPSDADGEYGWISPGGGTSTTGDLSSWPVSSFVEKPPPNHRGKAVRPARRLEHDRGCRASFRPAGDLSATPARHGRCFHTRAAALTGRARRVPRRALPRPGRPPISVATCLRTQGVCGFASGRPHWADPTSERRSA